MTDQDLSIEEYRALQSEASGFTSDNYRDGQLVLAALTAIAAIAGFAKDDLTAKPVLLLVGHLTLFVVLLVQLSRLAHLRELQRKLASIEFDLVGRIPGKMSWNTDVPTRLLGPLTVPFHAKLALGLAYTYIFGRFGAWAWSSKSVEQRIVFVVEGVILLYFLARFVKDAIKDAIIERKAKQAKRQAAAA